MKSFNNERLVNRLFMARIRIQANWGIVTKRLLDHRCVCSNSRFLCLNNLSMSSIINQRRCSETIRTARLTGIRLNRSEFNLFKLMICTNSWWFLILNWSKNFKSSWRLIKWFKKKKEFIFSIKSSFWSINKENRPLVSAEIGALLPPRLPLNAQKAIFRPGLCQK